MIFWKGFEQDSKLIIFDYCSAKIKIEMVVELKRTTYEEFRQMEFDGNDNFLYELINGEIVKKSAPSLRHQELSSNTYDILKTHIKKNGLGKFFYAPIDVFLDEYCVPTRFGFCF